MGSEAVDAQSFVLDSEPGRNQGFALKFGNSTHLGGMLGLSAVASAVQADMRLEIVDSFGLVAAVQGHSIR